MDIFLHRLLGVGPILGWLLAIFVDAFSKSFVYVIRDYKIICIPTVGFFGIFKVICTYWSTVYFVCALVFRTESYDCFDFYKGWLAIGFGFFYSLIDCLKVIAVFYSFIGPFLC